MGNQERYVETFSIDPFYTGSNIKGNKFLWHDVGVIHTKEPFNQAPNVDTICLPNPDTTFSNRKCFSMGWGKNSQADSNGQDIMKQVSLNLMENHKKCAKDLIATDELSY